MVDAGIGRLLISSLHQGIADLAPTRLEFYENWLSPAGMRDGRLGLAPLGAVLSFLHREGPPLNQQIPVRAGTYAADWCFAELSSSRRWLIRRMPASLRVRAALGVARRLVRATIRQASVKSSVRGGQANIDIRSAAFEQLRPPASIPMQGFYAAAVQRLLTLSGIEANVAVATEHETGWNFTVTITGTFRVDTAKAA